MSQLIGPSVTKNLTKKLFNFILRKDPLQPCRINLEVKHEDYRSIPHESVPWLSTTATYTTRYADIENHQVVVKCISRIVSLVMVLVVRPVCPAAAVCI